MQKNIFLLCIVVIATYTATAQHTLKAIIKDNSAKTPLPFASVRLKKAKTGTLTDSTGVAILTNIPGGQQHIIISSVNYSEKEIALFFPLESNDPIEILLESEEEELEEIVIKSTRSSRTIKNMATRVEIIDAEEVDEKNNMRPANVSMLLHESTGISVQQTSATSANAAIRIQGLDGRYTQVLKDGFPNYSGFSGGLSILEIPPLDLKQVEVIKGPSSTLYGGGAVAGVINFITVDPGNSNYTKLLLNQSHVGQTNIAAFTSYKKNKTGLTILATGNRQQAYDVDEDDFSELPQVKDVTISPKLFFYIDSTARLIIGHTLTIADRRGGDMLVIKGNADNFHTYFENNNTIRNNTNIEFEKRYNKTKKITARQSISFFDRSIAIPAYRFKGLQTNTYTDINLSQELKKHIVITGVNFIYDHFKENKNYSGATRDDKNITSGIYIQDTWDATEKFSFENGLRIDATNRYGVFVLPRISVLYKINSVWNSRIGGGMGYKLPTLFTEKTEAIQYRNVDALQNVKAEKSYGATADINFRKRIADKLEFSVNQLFFYTIIKQPLILQTGITFSFVNSDKSIQSYGFETNMKFIYNKNWKLFTGYTLNETKAGWLSGNQFLPLVPKTRLNIALIYEKEDFLKIGLEGYRTGHQYLSGAAKTPVFWEFGLMAEKPFTHFSLFINAENFTDVRQSNYKSVVNDTHPNPTFDEIWTHTEGFVLNGGIKIKI